MLIAVGDNVERSPFGHTGDEAKQGPRRRIEIDANPVHATFHHRLKRLLQLALIDVMLILADADRFGIYLDQLRQRIL